MLKQYFKDDFCVIVVFSFLSVFSGYALSDTDYRLGPGDLVDILVYEEPGLSLEVRIDSTGTISYPFLGQIKVSGKTPGELEGLIKTRLQNGFIVSPNVTVRILEYRPYFVIGEVKNPGLYEFQPGLTVNKAISIAGGFTERASKSAIYIQSGSIGSVENESDDSKGDSQARARLSTTIQPGDLITIEQSFF